MNFHRFLYIVLALILVGCGDPKPLTEGDHAACLGMQKDRISDEAFEDRCEGKSFESPAYVSMWDRETGRMMITSDCKHVYRQTGLLVTFEHGVPYLLDPGSACTVISGVIEGRDGIDIEISDFKYWDSLVESGGLWAEHQRRQEVSRKVDAYYSPKAIAERRLEAEIEVNNTVNSEYKRIREDYKSRSHKTTIKDVDGVMVTEYYLNGGGYVICFTGGRDNGTITQNCNESGTPES